MSQFSTQTKSPPWVRTANHGWTTMGQPSQLMQTSSMMSSTHSLPAAYQQQQILGMQQLQQQQHCDSVIMAQQLQSRNKSYGTMSTVYPFQQTSTLSTLTNIDSRMPVPVNSLAAASSQQESISYPTPRTLQPGGSYTNQLPPITNVLPPSAGHDNAGGNCGGLTPKQRVFTGTITNLNDYFGFIDKDVFFRTDVCTKELPPKVGERALVVACYKAAMPFKWNATRVQILPSGMHQQKASQGVGSSAGYNAVPPPETFHSGGFGGSPIGDGNRSRSDRKLDQRSRDNKERNAEREKRREERLREEKKCEKEKRSRSPSTRCRSRSPRTRTSRSPCRRARIVPRYVVQIPKISLDLSEANVLELKRRYTNLYVPSDFFTTRFRWVDAFPPNRPLTMSRPCAFHVMHKEVEEILENTAVLEPVDADYSFSAKVMLLGLPGLEEIFRKSCTLAEDMKDGKARVGHVHPTRLINFLVGVRGKNEPMAIGGPWSPSMDGPNPESDPSVLIKTAIRSCKALTGIDLSGCTQWYRFVEIYYRRGESTHKGKAVSSHVETVVLFLPNVWCCVPTRLEWDSLQQNYKNQLFCKLKDEQDSTSSSSSNGPTNGTAVQQKVTDLCQNLKARLLSFKGLKSQLVARLNKTVKTEHEIEEAGEKATTEAAQQVQVQAHQAVNMEVESETGEKKKSEDEEKCKQEEREQQARERRFALPDIPHILVHPSRTAKSGKFDCTVMSLSVLLDYRQEDTKEHSFEVSLFAELFNEMLMRDFGFRIYRSLVDAPERSTEEDKNHKEKDNSNKGKEILKKRDDDSNKEKEKKKEADNDLEEEEVNEESSSSKKKDEKTKERKKEKVKMVTVDRDLLLAFVYFDQSHCGYIFDKDVEEILYTLGLNLSRAQCRKLLQKVVTRDTLNYRKLTDRPRDTSKNKANVDEDAKHQEILAAGNRLLLPAFVYGEHTSSQQHSTDIETSKYNLNLDGVVTYRESVVDIGNLLQQLERSEKSRIDAEEKMVQMQAQLIQTKKSAKESNQNVDKLVSKVCEYHCKLEETEDGLKFAENNCSKLIVAIGKIQEILKPVYNEFAKPMLSEELIGNDTLNEPNDASCSSPIIEHFSMETDSDVSVKQKTK